ncbi:MAG: hypothetical protein CFE43_18850 [Burkholderiales bacterium PBB3]|nr:MAG: hypothetical protein CFE43_18850 [Burkholderiales bacterium PBB3]
MVLMPVAGYYKFDRSCWIYANFLEVPEQHRLLCSTINTTVDSYPFTLTNMYKNAFTKPRAEYRYFEFIWLGRR